MKGDEFDSDHLAGKLRNILLISGHDRNWHAGASTVYLHLEQELCRLGLAVKVFHKQQLIRKKFSGWMERLLAARSVCQAAYGEAIKADVVDVAGNVGHRLFRKLRKSKKRPLLVNRLHGLEFLDEQARMTEEIAGQIRLPLKYKLVTRHLTNRAERLTLFYSDMIICHSSRDADAIVAAGWALPDKIWVLPLGVEERFFWTERNYEQTNRLLWWGSWVERKGIHYLPRIFELVATELKGCRLTIGGSGQAPEQILSKFSEQLRSRIDVLPRVSAEEHVQILRSHDVFLFPSLSEGFGLALLEAMASGLPVVTTQTGMAHDHLEHGVNCLIVPMAAPTATSRALTRLMKDTKLRREIGTRAGIDARQLTWRRMGMESLSAYEATRVQAHGKCGAVALTG